MTAQERNQIEELRFALERMAENINGYREEVHIHIAKTDEKFDAFKQLCDERHGIRPGSIQRLQAEVGRGRGFREAAVKFGGWLFALGLVVVEAILKST